MIAINMFKPAYAQAYHLALSKLHPLMKQKQQQIISCEWMWKSSLALNAFPLIVYY